MGSACSRKRGQLLVDEEDLYSARFSKSSSFKWLLHTLPRSGSDVHRKVQGPVPVRCPSLMELCVAKVREDIGKYSDFSLLPRDLSQQVFNELVEWNILTEELLGAFRDCALQDICLADYPGVRDAWMEVAASQGQSLLSVDISCSDVTDGGLNQLKDCINLQSLSCNYCDQISEHGLKTLSGLSNVTSLSFKKCSAVTAEGAKAFANMVNLGSLDLERCPKIHGGLVHLKGLRKLEKLNLRYCNGITDSDMKHLSDLTNLRELQLSCCKISDLGVSYLRGLSKLAHLNLEGCAVTAACLEVISGLASLVLLNLSRCGVYDEGCEHLEGLVKLKVLNLGFNYITDACLVHLKELINLECLNLDSCKIGDEGLAHLKVFHKTLKAENHTISLMQTSETKKLGTFRHRSWEQWTSSSLWMVFLSSQGLTGLTHLDLFGARITDAGTNCLKYFKNLQSLEVCGGLITDAGVKNIKDLKALTLLNLSQNGNLTDKSLELISRLTALVSLNVSNSRVSNSGLHHLKPLQNLRSLSLESCKVTAIEIKKLQLAALPNLVSVRPE
uniref:OSJNBa0014K14.7 protein n=1 Tax=Oryza sativa subsp. japonica TaxID=39947 RepID=Q7XQW8_ORYSJ|nr:OSJNBa0014K14.7 [Oryza sativa Japonica Group]